MMNTAQRLISKTVALLCALAGVLAFAGAPAQAKVVHIPGGSFGSEGSGSGQFREPRGIAVNDTTHDVYVVDSANNRVEEFNTAGTTVLAEFNGSAAPTGAFSEPTLIAIDNSGNPLDPSAGDVYVIDAHHHVIDKFSETGAYLGQLTGSSPGGIFTPFAALAGVAVSPSGEVWMVDDSGSSGNIYNFSDALVNQYLAVRGTEGGFGALNQGLAVDPEGDLFVNTLKIAKVDASGKTLIHPFCGEVKNGTVEPLNAEAVAGDWQSGEVFVDNGGSIGVCGLNGEPLDGFGFGAFKFNQSHGVAVDEGNGTVYAVASAPAVAGEPGLGAADEVLVFDAVTLPTVTVGALSEQRPRSVMLNGMVNPEGSPVTSCVFEYDTREYKEGEGAHGTSVPCSPGSLGEGSSPVPVSVHLSGLTAETRYDYRLVAENSAHVPSATSNQEFTAGPVLGGEFVTDVASDSATLGVGIDPNGDDTHYYFQYGTSVSYGSYAPLSPPGVDLGSGSEGLSESFHLQGLDQGTVYHYRVVVVQDGEEFDEPDRTFMTQRVAGGPALPDGRAWELVSPADNEGGLIEQFSNGGGDEIQAASNGSAITYLTVGTSVGEDPQGKINWSQTLSARDQGGGWSSEDLTLPRRLPENEKPATDDEARPEYKMFSSDLSLAAVQPPAEDTPPLSPEATERTVYLRDDLDGSYEPLVTAGNVPPETSFGGVGFIEQLEFVTATADLSHVVLASPFALTEEAVFGGPEYISHDQWNLYEWSGGRLRLVNILPEAEGGEATRGAEPHVRLAGGNEVEGTPSEVNPSAVSSDGRRIAWTLGVPVLGEDYKGLYVRDMVEERTVKVAGPGASFQWMSSDGSEVFYLEGGDLYVFDFATRTDTDLTADHGAGETSGGVQELVSDVSRDGSYVYFVAKSVLAGATGAVSGGDNLYVLHDSGSVWSTTYVATLSPGDERDWYASEVGLPDLSRISSRVSPDGRFLAFMSDRPLTGYDNTDAVSGHPDEEVYLYDAGTSRLVCASCDPTGARPVGVLDPEGGSSSSSSLLVDRGRVWGGHWLAGSVPSWDVAFAHDSHYQPRYLSDSGRLFFDSADPLVPRSTNGLEDVYEYEPEGVPEGEHGCSRADAGGSEIFKPAHAFQVEGVEGEEGAGCVGLISSGTSSVESAFFDASENGDDVFFVTAAKLVGEDQSNSNAVYDAHVCGSEGVACVSEAVSPPPCDSGDSCKAAPSPQPEIFGLAPSATFSGAGNIAPEPVKPAARAKAKSLTRAQKLAKAVKACKRDKSKKKRATCEKQAQRSYGRSK